MHSISKKSFVVRVACGSNPPTRISVFGLVSEFFGTCCEWFFFGVLTVMLAIIMTVAAIYLLFFGYRPSFIKFWKKFDEPFVKYNLPTFFGKRIWPIFPISFIVLGVALRNVDYLFQPVYRSLGKDVIWLMLFCGIVEILFIVLEQFESWRKFLSRIKSWWEEKGCIKLNVVE